MAPIIVEVLSKFHYSEKSNLQKICQLYCSKLNYNNISSKNNYQLINKLAANKSKINCFSIRLSLQSDKELKRFLDNTQNLTIYFIFNEKYLNFNITYEHYNINYNIHFIFTYDNPVNEIISELYNEKLIDAIDKIENTNAEERCANAAENTNAAEQSANNVENTNTAEQCTNAAEKTNMAENANLELFKKNNIYINNNYNLYKKSIFITGFCIFIFYLKYKN